MTLNPTAILHALEWDPPRRIEQIMGGADAAIWRVETQREVVALRVLRPEQKRRWRNERAAMTCARDAGFPVPKVLRDGIVDGRPAALLEWCAGRTIIDVLAERPDALERLGRLSGRLQAGIHAIAAPAHVTSLEHPFALGTGCSLLHMDFHPLNLITDGERITGVIDWANARCGDPRMDLARSITILWLTPLPPSVRQGTTPAMRRRLARAWWQGYVDLAGEQTGMAEFLAIAGQYLLEDIGPRLTEPERRRIERRLTLLGAYPAV